MIDVDTDPRPITYSDYLQVRQGAESTATLQALLNDLDPRGGSLELIDLIPDAPAERRSSTASSVSWSTRTSRTGP